MGNLLTRLNLFSSLNKLVQRTQSTIATSNVSVSAPAFSKTKHTSPNASNGNQAANSSFSKTSRSSSKTSRSSSKTNRSFSQINNTSLSSSVKSVELTELNKYYDDFHALKDINLTIEDGEFISFLGPSGCGKTTLLRTIAGLETCNQGTILLSGKDVTQKPARQRDFGIVFQSYALFPNLTVSENIGYALKSRGTSKADIQARVQELIELVGLNDLADRFPAQLSGGQQQRVALARALAPNPQLLLLDEPLSALDAKVRHNLRQELKDLQKKTGITTIMVTHDQEEALAISDRIAVLNHGRIEQIGTPDEIYSTPATEFVAEFVGTINRIKLPNSNEPLIVRPEWIEVFNTPDENRMSAVIESMEYRGATTRLTLGMVDKDISQDAIEVDVPTAGCKKTGFELNQAVWFEIVHEDLCTPQH
ncbi:ABC transporter ATP-binding protein [Litoribrevibacter euphylliae]|uniref:ABC transporter ATP-binding protein n=1 Tax=Litoribrevibacter euphylliae TaxID=1834034 RepID=A0ABV7HHK7_9GAMM